MGQPKKYFSFSMLISSINSVTSCKSGYKKIILFAVVISVLASSCTTVDKEYRSVFKENYEEMNPVTSFQTVTKKYLEKIHTVNKDFNKKISDDFLKKQGLDAHTIKSEFLGKKNIAHYDLYKQTDTGEILIFGKSGTGEPIFTGIFTK